MINGLRVTEIKKSDVVLNVIFVNTTTERVIFVKPKNLKTVVRQ